MENESIEQRGMGINYKGIQGQTEEAVALYEEEEEEEEDEEEEELTICVTFPHWDTALCCIKVNFSCSGTHSFTSRAT